jgi:23S rRNA pseudouridine1911/1915/1917 synthase
MLEIEEKADVAGASEKFAAVDADDGVRLDRFLSGRIETLSRARLQDLIRKGFVERLSPSGARVSVTDPNHTVRNGDVFAVSVPDAEPYALAPEEIELKILFEDKDIVVIDKQAGLVVHPGAGNQTGTLVHALLAHCGDSLSGIGGVARPGIVHRLDKDTSGIMVAAKNDRAHQGLAEQFADHGRDGDLRRDYIALVWGEPKARKGRIETQIGRHPSSRVKMAVLRQGGRVAITNYVVGSVLRGAGADSKLPRGLISKVRCSLETGRTHQVRVHMAHIGTPILGDKLYSVGFETKAGLLPDPIKEAALLMNRQALHAAFLQFRHPRTGRLLKFESAPPPDMSKLCSACERS